MTKPEGTRHHVEELSPSLTWGPEDYRDRHLSTQDGDTRLFDPRCPRCVADWASGKLMTLVYRMQQRMNKTPIEWTDYTWNPIRARIKGHAEGDGKGWTPAGTFCTRISPGCTHCYASVINKRFGNGLEYTVPNLERVDFFIDEKILEEPLRRKKPARIFVGDMFDLFHKAIGPFLIATVLDVMVRCPQHTFQLLTKRAARMQEILLFTFTPSPAPPNIWCGVSVEDQQRADERIPLLLETPAAVRFLSVEPMLEMVDLDGDNADHVHALGCGDDNHRNLKGTCRGVDWVICGGESGPGARPFNLEWAVSLLKQCRAAGVPFFMKQTGANLFCQDCADQNTHFCGKYKPKDRKGGDPSEWPEALRIREFPCQRAEVVSA